VYSGTERVFKVGYSVSGANGTFTLNSPNSIIVSTTGSNTHSGNVLTNPLPNSARNSESITINFVDALNFTSSPNATMPTIVLPTISIQNILTHVSGRQYYIERTITINNGSPPISWSFVSGFPTLTDATFNNDFNNKLYFTFDVNATSGNKTCYGKIIDYWGFEAENTNTAILTISYPPITAVTFSLEGITYSNRTTSLYTYSFNLGGTIYTTLDSTKFDVQVTNNSDTVVTSFDYGQTYKFWIRRKKNGFIENYQYYVSDSVSGKFNSGIIPYQFLSNLMMSRGEISRYNFEYSSSVYLGNHFLVKSEPVATSILGSLINHSNDYEIYPWGTVLHLYNNNEAGFANAITIGPRLEVHIIENTNFVDDCEAPAGTFEYKLTLLANDSFKNINYNETKIIDVTKIVNGAALWQDIMLTEIRLR
jgi:hypothetical protein